jgi:hypothetical protein
MTDHTDEAEKLSELLADALTADAIETDLLLRYSREPASLGADERQRVESYLAASPAHRDRLRVLTRIASSPGGILGGGQAASLPEEEAAKVIPISSHPRWRTRAPLIGFALAASLALAVLYGRDAGLDPVGQPAVQIADDGAAAGEPLATPEGGLWEIEVAPDLSPHEPEVQIAREADDVVTPTLGPTPVEPEDAALAPEPALVIAEATPPPAPAPEPRPDVVRQPEPEAIPDEIVTGEPIVIAMNISGPLLYTPPTGSAALESLGGLRSSAPGMPKLQALAPTHVGQTLHASPTLYWYSSVETNARVDFVLADRVSVDPALEFTVASPVPPGIHAVRLEDHGVVLAPGVEYRWFVTIAAAGGDPSADIVTRGAIERVAPRTELQARLEAAEPSERGQIYAEQGLWYDALAFVSEGVESTPLDERLRELRAELLEQAGLQEAADFDRSAVATTR